MYVGEVASLGGLLSCWCVVLVILDAGQTKGSVWEAMEELQEPELLKLADELLDTVLHI